jgi:nuclear cap-binding protein subunit 1
LLRIKAPESEIQEQITAIQDLASERGVPDPLVPSTDAYVTSICFLGSKSLSHVLSCIERCKERLMSISSASDLARHQIISSVMEYWAEKPGTGVNIVDKLLNYAILTPLSVVEWALVQKLERGNILIRTHVHELISSTAFKVTNRVRQVVTARNQPGLPADQVAILDETLEKDRGQMAALFALIEDAILGIAEGGTDAMAEDGDHDEQWEAMLRSWGRRWLRVFRRKKAVEEAWLQETLAEAARQRENGHGNGVSETRAEAMDDGLGNDIP